MPPTGFGWVSGERATTGARGFNPSFQRHVAAYRLGGGFLPPGLTLDLGCGTGHSFAELSPRPTVGLDIAWRVLRGQERRTCAADIRRLPFVDSCFDGIFSSHSVEHVPDPERVIRESARVMHDAGTAVFVTPNRLTFGRPEEVIDPYHFREYDAEELEALCRTGYPFVRVFGVFSSPEYAMIVSEEHRTLDRMLSWDRFGVRRRVPRRLKQAGYDAALSWSRRRSDELRDSIKATDFFLSAERLEQGYDLVAVCRRTSPG